MEFPAWDPVLFDIPGLPIDVRWYGLMYIVGFVCAQWILVRLARVGFFPIKPELAGDLILYCVIGVMLGGRTGYALFYDHSLLGIPNFFQVWKGGLAFHGGLGGVAVASWLFGRKHGLAFLRVVDVLALSGCPGILAVRFANFLNGELYGRVTDQATFGAMQFPTDPVATRAMRIDGLSMRDRELCIQYAYRKIDWATATGKLSAVDEHGRKVDWEAMRPLLDWQKVRVEADVPYRHPSQIYEGLAEGLVLGLVLLAVYLLARGRQVRRGAFCALFLFGYAIARWLLERVRQPDSQFVTADHPDGSVFLGMTMGQTLSCAMLVGGALMLAWPQKKPVVA
ncbi:MAG: prolipoprotein diacylglyceryl transferase [Planctomycetes bacterium]|nr:prolipoprotein diacylglyceryl transferase [Planctomycetota bacterium]